MGGYIICGFIVIYKYTGAFFVLLHAVEENNRDTTTTYNLARKGLLVDALQTGDDFVYSNQLILVDSEKRIRGYYSGTLTNDLVKLNDEIKVLITEELRRNDKPLYWESRFEIKSNKWTKY